MHKALAFCDKASVANDDCVLSSLWKTIVCLTLVHSVRGNDIGPEGAKHFADALVVNQSITSLGYAHTPNALAF